MDNVRDSCQEDGNFAIPDDPIPIKKTDNENCETVVASWNQFRWRVKHKAVEHGTCVV